MSLWAPSQDRIDRANLSRFMRFVREEIGNADLNSYAPLYRLSIDQPARFWTLLWDFVGIRGSGERTPVLVDDDGIAAASWFPGVSLNFAQNLLRFDDERIAIRCHGIGADQDGISHAQLQRRVAVLAAALRARGLQPGDTVAALLPNVAETLIAMLATASVGATWFACPPRLAGSGLLRRLAPAVLFVEKAAALPGIDAGEVATVIALQPEADARVIGLEALVAPFADADAEYAMLPFAHPLYLTVAADAADSTELLVHGAGGTLIQHLKELVLHLDLKREDKLFFHADNDSLAWYWLASSLAVGCTLVLHGGDDLSPEGTGVWDLVDELGITVLGLHAHWINAAAAGGWAPGEQHRLLTLKTVLTAGAPLSPEGYDFIYGQVKQRLFLAPVSTAGDTLACLAMGAPLLPVSRGEISVRALGMRVEVLDASGQAATGDAGDLVCAAPFPSMPLGYREDPSNGRFIAAYFSRHPGCFSGGERAVLTARESLVLLKPDA